MYIRIGIYACVSQRVQYYTHTTRINYIPSKSVVTTCIMFLRNFSVLHYTKKSIVIVFFLPDAIDPD